MFSHQPLDYLCPFCDFVAGNETEYKKFDDILYENENVLAFVAPKWWRRNPGHVIVIPKKHFENIYDIPDDLLAEVYKTVKRISHAIRSTYECDGTSTRQHNEPAGNQDVWHLHIHVFPRYQNDRLYQNHDDKEFVSPEVRKPYAVKLRDYLATNNDHLFLQ